MGYDETKLINKENYRDFETPVSAGSFQPFNKKKVQEFEAEVNSLYFPEIKPLEKSADKNATFAKIEDIYFQPEFTSEEFQRTHKLLAEAEKHCQEAIKLYKKDKLIGSDDSVQHLQALLPELFCCRDLSKSLGSIINAVQNALFNNNGLLLSEIKLIALQKIISELRNQPFMKFDKAIDLIMDFEDADFVVQPQGFEQLAEILDEQE